eukprot:symbB.v1.2.002291.t3/scaffold107.1/size327550/7
MFLGACRATEPEEPSPTLWCISEYLPEGDLERYFMKMQVQHEWENWHPNLLQMVQWSSAVARALAFLHKVPILHRDLKPLNLLLTKHFELKVSDLGISKVAAKTSSKNAKDSYVMTGGVGSWRYMAPEVVRHQAYNEKVDIFALGLIMYFMNSGHQPFYQWGKDPEVILKEYLKGEEPRPTVLDCDLKASPLRSLSRGAAATGLSLGSAVTPRSSQGAALARAASNHSIRSLSSVGARTPRTPITPRTPKTPNNAFFSPTTGGVAGYASNVVAAATRTEESLPSLVQSECNSPERHANGSSLRYHSDLPILLGQAAATTSVPSPNSRSVHFQDDLDSFARSTREMVMSRQRARKERKEMLDKAMRESGMTR